MKVKAVALFSGGLDSQLSVLMVQEQGVEVVGITFSTPFFTPEAAIKAAEQLELPLEVEDFTQGLMELIKSPVYGHGKNLNPCIDCHALMVKKAGQYMEKIGAQFIITGEVLGERPKSQNYKALEIVARESGYEGLLLRPLSARQLSPTIPEQKGWVDREKLGDIQGRSRKPQMALAKKYELKEYPSPAGGCLLTVEGFSQKLKDLLADNPDPQRLEIELLKVGRHFRLAPGIKLVVGRNHEENNTIESLAQLGDRILKAANIPGPTALYRGEGDYLPTAAALTARYSDAEGESVPVIVTRVGKEGQEEITVKPLEDKKIAVLRIE
ncbi:tRNA 4-thiouridine(8) synthase ThiI [Candidatus Contubernalis alkaliaceticus]|uniref:tRNA 4-thiouridine(8) synthase ThiI n=1 Tax=Candidatus Contubernalis alkaliaceticus TaxID=338645 RepID=UPI001F4C0BC6|nr:tRNA 4-thiouridine(8) synthase ThiI [Candidatus Contubernalis alkalaceticus]UNC90671.1 tRNA 4-thiouridine(8) synthase ThiI [Candidatus Contubernalis alkalaceticus]